MTYEMNGDRIMAKRVQLQQKSNTGLILSVETEVDKDRDFVFAKIVSIGEGRQLEQGFIPTKYKEGDYIVYNERVPLKFKYAGEVHDIIRENEVVMKVSGEDVIETDEFTLDFLNKLTSERPASQPLEGLQ